MAGKDIIIMRQKELKYLHVIREVMEKRIRQRKAAELLGISTRQVRRKVKRIRAEGDKGIIHRLRGKVPNNAKPEKLKAEVRQLYQEKYWDFGPTLASEKLFEKENIKLSAETVRLWLLESNDWKKRRKGRKHRKWRERKHCCGEMLQADGSHHAWFEDRGPKCVLMAYIDDATSRVYGRFYEYEGTIPAMDSFKRYIKKYGIPQSIYMDNHSTYKSQAKPTVEDELEGKIALSQFERAVKELEVRFIHTQSAPAKGRIERLFGTFQDRVLKEMRLEGVSSIKEANKFLERYLPKYNRRFSVPAVKSANLHRSVTKDMDIDSKLCIKAERVLRNDFTVSYENKLYQVMVRTNAKKVTVERRITGRIVISHKGRVLKHKEIAKRLPRLVEQKTGITKKGTSLPPKNHPWKRWIERGYPQNPSYQQKEKRSKKEKELLLLVH
ncbi:MAG: ISNCY family transposase [Candidatus Auribacterota bacterium]|nr:ISNCY family transposase [Candidatus Auribacterota bacterium]